MKVNWSLEDLFTYMETWSSVKEFQMEKKYDPLSIVKDEIKNLWGRKNTKKVVKWTINLRVGFIQNKFYTDSICTISLLIFFESSCEYEYSA
jgi:hypothetical protein